VMTGCIAGGLLEESGESMTPLGRYCFSGIADEWWLVMSHSEPVQR